MFLFNIQTKDNRIIRFERDVITNKITVDRIAFIKAIRDTMLSGLRESKDFCDLMLNELNKMSASADLVRVHIRQELDEITNSEDLLDILRFVRTAKDHPKPANAASSNIFGSFTEDGTYIPNARL